MSKLINCLYIDIIRILSTRDRDERKDLWEEFIEHYLANNFILTLDVRRSIFTEEEWESNIKKWMNSRDEEKTMLEIEDLKERIENFFYDVDYEKKTEGIPSAGKQIIKNFGICFKYAFNLKVDFKPPLSFYHNLEKIRKELLDLPGWIVKCEKGLIKVSNRKTDKKDPLYWMHEEYIVERKDMDTVFKFVSREPEYRANCDSNVNSKVLNRINDKCYIFSVVYGGIVSFGKKMSLTQIKFGDILPCGKRAWCVDTEIDDSSDKYAITIDRGSSFALNYMESIPNGVKVSSLKIIRSKGFIPSIIRGRNKMIAFSDVNIITNMLKYIDKTS